MTRKNEVTLRGPEGTPLLTVPCTFTEVAGTRVAIHRHYRSKHGGPELMCTRSWQATEPVTGHKVTGPQNSREEAIQAAHARITAEGGAEVLRERIAQRSAWLAGADLV